MIRAAAVTAAKRAHLEGPARVIHGRLQPWVIRRNRLDEERLTLLLSAILAPTSNCVDVGAHVGSFLEDILRLAPSGTHVAFEPLPNLAAELRRRFPSVAVEAVALSDASGERTFAHVVAEPAVSGFSARSISGAVEILTVKTCTLDGGLPPDYEPDLIKIDVEGAELAVLRGAAGTIERYRPFVVFEHGKAAREHYGTDSGDLFGFLEEYGYSLMDMDGRRYRRSEFPNAKRWNFLASPLARLRPRVR